MMENFEKHIKYTEEDTIKINRLLKTTQFKVLKGSDITWGVLMTLVHLMNRSPYWIEYNTIDLAMALLSADKKYTYVLILNFIDKYYGKTENT